MGKANFYQGLESGYTGDVVSTIHVTGVVARNAAAVTVEYEGVVVAGSSKRDKGDPFNANAGGDLAIADALERLARKLREAYK